MYPLSLIPYPYIPQNKRKKKKLQEKEKNTSSQTIPYTFGLNDTFFSNVPNVLITKQFSFFRIPH